MSTTWRKGLVKALERNGEKFSDIVSSTLTEEELDKEFDPGYGGTEGVPFTVWTDRFVYFPAQYDGSEWVDCVSRNPNGKPTEHVGG